MTITLPFKQMDVFTTTKFKGNPVAVVNCMGIDESDITAQQMQDISRWTNLSETTFLFKPTSPEYDYKLRIFTPAIELPFAGHPTVGSCKAFLEFTNNTTATFVKQECGLGIINLTIKLGEIFFKAERADIDKIDKEAMEDYAKALGISVTKEPLVLDVGPYWVVFHVKDAETCYNANPNYSELAAVSEKFGHTGIIMAGPKSSGSSLEYEMRAFAPSIGINEDPVCGSGSIALIAYLQEIYSFEKTTNVTISQGGRISRKGEIHSKIEIIDQGNPNFISGGNAISIIAGEINI